MSIKRNFIFSAVLTVANYIFPFLVYPYAARVLGPENMGICNFVDSIVNYAMMLSMMGIAIVGVRDIAQAKGNRRELDISFTALMTVCTVFTLLSTVLLVGCTLLLPALQPYRKLLLIGVLKLWSNFLLIDWFYRGLEDFRYITIRTIIVKSCYVLSVFLFVHIPADYVVYYLLLCLMYTANAAFNCAKAFRMVSFKFSAQAIKRTIKPYVVLGVYTFLSSLYYTLNVIYLGFTHGDTEVGYYTTATKTFQIILALYTAYSGVIIPRASVLISEERHGEFKKLIYKSIDALLLFALPTICFSMIFSDAIIYVIGGPQYTGSIIPMTIVMPLVLIIGYEQILVLQILTPLSSDRVILFNSMVGAIVGIIGNLLLVKPFSTTGAAVVWVLAEIAVLISAQYFVKVKTGISFPYRNMIRNILAYVPYCIIAYYVSRLPIGLFERTAIGAIILFVYFILIQRYYLHNQIYNSLTPEMIKRKLSKR